MGDYHFTYKNMKHYCGEIPDDYILENDEIVVVMTDLIHLQDYLACLHLFISPTEKKLLHNQRIGKINFDKEKILPEFLYFNLLNDGYRNR